MVFYVEPEPGSGKRIARNPEADRLQKLENATFVTTELGRFSKTLDNEFANRVNAGGARHNARSCTTCRSSSESLMIKRR